MNSLCSCLFFVLLIYPAYQQVPDEFKVTLESDYVRALEGESAEVSCTTKVPIKTCYLLTTRPWVYHIKDDMTNPDVEYVGKGLELGECKVKVNDLKLSDTGTWGFMIYFAENPNVTTVNFILHIQEQLYIEHYMINDTTLAIDATMLNNRSLDFCSFSNNVITVTALNGLTPVGCLSLSDLPNGRCSLRLPHHSAPRQPWLVTARVEESYALIKKTSWMPYEAPPSPPDYSTIILYILMGSSCVLLIIGALFIPRELNYAGWIKTELKKLRKQPPHSGETVAQPHITVDNDECLTKI